MALPPNPTDLDRLQVAWNSLRAMVNVNLPSWSHRVLAALSKIAHLRP